MPHRAMADYETGWVPDTSQEALGSIPGRAAMASMAGLRPFP